MTYEARPIRRQRVLYNSANTTNKLKYQLILDGAKAEATSATITIYKPGSTTAVLSATAMTLVGVNSTIFSYPVSTTNVADYPVSSGYRADIAITYSSAVYNRSFVFDVVKYLFDINISIDQLRAFDDSIQGLQHISDEDFSELIESCYGQLQAKIEGKVFEDKKLLSNMILDSTKVSQAAMLYILGRIHFNKGDMERYNEYKSEFKELWDFVLSSIQYDSDQDGQENSTIGGITEVRLML